MTYPIHTPIEYFFGSRRFGIAHRTLDDKYIAIDIDLIGWDGRRKRVTYVIEATTSDAAGKNCAATKHIAKCCDSRGYIVQMPKMLWPQNVDTLTWRAVADLVINEQPSGPLTIRRVWPEPERIWRNQDWTRFGSMLSKCAEVEP